jgi:hypothetical protein
MAVDHKIIKHPPKFKGLNKSVNSTDLPTGYAEEVKNAVVNSDGSLSKRKGFKTSLDTDKGIFGMEVYNNVVGNDTYEELIIANTHLNKLKKNNFTVSYAKPYSNSYHSLYLNPETETYFYEIYDVPTDNQVVKVDLGTEEASKVTIQQLLDTINSVRVPIITGVLGANLSYPDTYQYITTTNVENNIIKQNISNTIQKLEQEYLNATGQVLPDLFQSGALNTRIIAADTYLTKEEKATLTVKADDSFLISDPTWRSLSSNFQSNINTVDDTSTISLRSSSSSPAGTYSWLTDAQGRYDNGILGLGSFAVGDTIKITNTATGSFSVEATLISIDSDLNATIDTSQDIHSLFQAEGNPNVSNYFVGKPGNVSSNNFPIFIVERYAGTDELRGRIVTLDEDGVPVLTYLDSNGNKDLVRVFQNPYNNELALNSNSAEVNINEFYSYVATYDGTDTSLAASRLSYASRENLFPRHSLFTSELEILPKALTASQLQLTTQEQKNLKEASIMPVYEHYTDDSILNKDVLRNASFAKINNVLYVGNGHDDMWKYDGNLVYKPGLPEFKTNFVSSIVDTEDQSSIFYSEDEDTPLTTTSGIGSNKFKYNYIFRFSYQDNKGNFITGEPSEPIEIESLYTSFKSNEYEADYKRKINTSYSTGRASLSILPFVAALDSYALPTAVSFLYTQVNESGGQIYTFVRQATGDRVLTNNDAVSARDLVTVSYKGDSTSIKFPLSTDLSQFYSGLKLQFSQDVGGTTYNYDNNGQGYTCKGVFTEMSESLFDPSRGYYKVPEYKYIAIEGDHKEVTSTTGGTHYLGGNFGDGGPGTTDYQVHSDISISTLEQDPGAQAFSTGIKDEAPSHRIYFNLEEIENNLIDFDTETSYAQGHEQEKKTSEGGVENVPLIGRKLQVEIYRTKMYNPGGDALEVAGQYYYVGNLSYDGNLDYNLAEISTGSSISGTGTFDDPYGIVVGSDSIDNFNVDDIIRIFNEDNTSEGEFLVKTVNDTTNSIEIYLTEDNTTGNIDATLVNGIYIKAATMYFDDNLADEAGKKKYVLVDTLDTTATPVYRGREVELGIDASNSSRALNPFLIFTQNYKRHDTPPKGSLLTVFKNCLIVSGNKDNLNNIQYSLPFNVLTGEIGSEYFPADDNGVVVESQQGDRINGIIGIRDVLYIFHDSSIHTLIGNLANPVGIPFVVDLMSNEGDLGTLNNQSLIEFKNKCLFLSKKGFYTADSSSSLEEMSADIQSLVKDYTLDFQRANVFNWSDKRLLMFSIPTENVDDYTDIITTEKSTTFIYDYYNNAWLEWDNIDTTGGVVEYDDTVFFASRFYVKDTNRVNSSINVFSNGGTDSDYNDNINPVDFSYMTNFESLGAPTVFKKFLRLKIHTFDNSEIYNKNVSNKLHITLHTDYIKNNKATFKLDSSKVPFGEGIWNFHPWGGSLVSGLKHKLLRNKSKSLSLQFKNNSLSENVKLNTYEIEIAAPFKQEIKE